MKPFSWLRRKAGKVSAQETFDLNDPRLREYMAGGYQGQITVENALRNPAVLRAVDLVCGSIAALPLYMKEKTAQGGRKVAEDHPLFPIFMFKPNPWQTAFEFKQSMQFLVLMRGDAVAIKGKTLGRTTSLTPVFGDVRIEQADNLDLLYHVAGKSGTRTYQSDDIFHLRGMTLDGVRGKSRVELVADVLNTAADAQRAARRLFQTGMMAGGTLSHKGALSPEAIQRLKAQMESFTGVDATGKWMVLEEGMETKTLEVSAQSAQLVETSEAQVAQVARVFGVPRPLMMMEETSWGSGIEQLAILYVRFTLMVWFRMWEDAIARSLIPANEWGRFYADFDETEFLRGTAKDQAEYLAKALGAGGQQPYITANEARETVGLGPHPDGDKLMAAGEWKNEQENTAAGA